MEGSADLTRSIYTVSGSNLAFESMDMVSKYLHRKWEVRKREIQSFSSAIGGFESGADIQTVRINDREAKVIRRRIVNDGNLETAIGLNW